MLQKINRLTVGRTAALWLAVLTTQLSYATPVPEEDIRAEYDYESMVQSQQTEDLVSQIVTTDQTSAQQAITRIAAGEPFDQVAHALSNDLSSRNKGGDLGWAVPAQYYKEIETALNAMKPGDVSKTPVQTKLGWHVLYLRDTRATPIASYEARHDILLKQLSERYAQIDRMSARTQYLVSMIAVQSQADVDAAMTWLKMGEPFDQVARSVSVDHISAMQGGDIGWVPIDDFSAAVATVIKAAQVGANIPQVVTIDGGFRLYLVRDRRVAVSEANRHTLDDMFFQLPSGPSVIKKLLDAGANPNAVKGDYSVLAANCELGSEAATAALLAGGAYPNGPVAAKRTPLDAAIVHSDDRKIPQLLLDKGASLFEPDANGYLPLGVAASLDRRSLIGLFVERRANIDQRNKNGMTALSIAAQYDKVQAARLLLDLGANPVEPIGVTDRGQAGFDSALSVATRYAQTHDNQSQVLTLLRSVSVDRALQRANRGLTAYVVQNGKRTLLDGHPVVLKRAPFSLEVKLKGGTDILVQATTSQTTADWITAQLNQSKFGDDSYAVTDINNNPQLLTVTDETHFRFEHLGIVYNKPTSPNLVKPDSEAKAIRPIQSLRLIDQAHPDAVTQMVTGTDTKAIYLTLAVGESIGRPLTAITKLSQTRLIFN